MRKRAIALGAFLIFSAGLLPSNALAHSTLVSSNPPADSQQSAFQKTISLTFNESLITIGSSSANSITLTSPEGKEIELTTPKIMGSTISADVVTIPEQEGSYTLSYRVVSSDGHPIEGGYTFIFSKDGSDVTSAPITTQVTPSGLQERGETGKAILIFVVVAGLALVAYRKFLGRK